MEKVKPIHVLALYVAGFLLINVVALGLYFVIDMGDDTLTLIRINSFTNIIFYGGLFLLFLYLYTSFWMEQGKHALRDKRQTIKDIAIGFGIMFIAMIVIGYVYQFLNIPENPENQAILEAQLNGPLFDKVVLVLFAVLLAPLVEEMVFRYGVMNLFSNMENMPKYLPLIISSLLFGGMHVLGDDLVQIIYYAGLGLILGSLYLKSNNILVPITVHLIFNGFVTVTMFLGI